MAGVYGNVILRENSNIVSIKENNLFEITTSIVYEEYLNCKSLLEACTDDCDRSILESKLELLYEVSIKDIIAKIKELWNRFKSWIKEKFNTIFKNKKDLDERSKKAIDKSAQLISNAKQKGLNESVILEETEEEYEKTYLDYEYQYKGNNIRKIEPIIDFAEECITLASKTSANLYDKIKASEMTDSEIKADLLDTIENHYKKFNDTIAELGNTKLITVKAKDHSYIDLLSSLSVSLKRTINDCDEINDSIKFANGRISKIENRIAPRQDIDLNMLSLIQKINNEAISNVQSVISILSKLSSATYSMQKYYTERIEKINKLIEIKLMKL